MRHLATQSWRFSSDLGQTGSAVLFVRDALGLPVDEAVGAPPRLIGEVPDRSALLGGADRVTAAAQWGDWWRAVGRFEADVRLGEVPGPEVHARYVAVISPDSSSGMADEFREVAMTLFREGCHWVDVDPGPRRGLDERKLAGFECHNVKDLVEEVASGAGVDTGDINGAVSVVLTEGVWGAVVSPGFAWCSLAAANDVGVCSEIIRAAFTSGLSRHR